MNAEQLRKELHAVNRQESVVRVTPPDDHVMEHDATPFQQLVYSRTISQDADKKSLQP